MLRPEEAILVQQEEEVDFRKIPEEGQGKSPPLSFISGEKVTAEATTTTTGDGKGMKKGGKEERQKAGASGREIRRAKVISHPFFLEALPPPPPPLPEITF